MCIRDSVYVLPYRPLSHAKLNQIKVPCLILAAQDDSMCASRFAVAAAQKIANAELALIPDKGHFDLYRGDGLQQVLARTTAFLKEHVTSA